MIATEQAKSHSHVLKILGNPLAYRIIAAIGRGRRRPMELSRDLDASASSIVNQLRVMKLAGLVRYHSTGVRRQGRKVVYWLADPSLLDACRALEGVTGRLRRLAGRA